MEEAGVRGVESRCVERKKEEEEKVRGKKSKLKLRTSSQSVFLSTLFREPAALAARLSHSTNQPMGWRS